MTRLTPLRPVLVLAHRNLWRTKVRSILAGLGIVVGVGAIVAIGVLGAGLEQAVVAEFGEESTEILIQPGKDSETTTLTARTVKDIRRVVGQRAVVPITRDVGVLSIGSNRERVELFRSARPDLLYEIERGLLPTPLRSGVLVGSDLADSLDLQPGNSVTVDDRSHRIRGVLASSARLFGPNPNQGIVLPPNTRDERGATEVVVRADDVQAANTTATAIEDALNGRRDTVQVTRLAEHVESLARVVDLVSTFLVGISAIALLVAGISILNVMLMSAVERRGEIGVFRAIGYRRRDVLLIFLTESLLLGCLGAAIGVLGGLALVIGLNELALEGSLTLLSHDSLTVILLGMAFGIGTALLSSLYPAAKAANEHPAEALAG